MTPVDPEDRLRAILHDEADRVAPSGGGLAGIQQRIEARRARRRWLVPATAAAAVALMVAGGIGYVATNHSDTQQRLTTGRTQTPTPQATTTPPSSASPSPTVTRPAFPTNAIYPYTSADQVNGSTASADPAKVAMSFVADYLRMPVLDRVTEKQLATDTAVISIGRQLPSESRQVLPATRVHLVRWQAHPGSSVWLVVGADTQYLSVTAPGAGVTVNSPLRVAGKITGVDESIEVDVRQASSSAPLGTTHVGGGGQDTPWSTTVSFSQPGADVGAIVAWTSSAIDGAPARVAVVPVRFHGSSGTTGTPAYWVGSKYGRITTFASRNGASLRYLTTPPAGFQDVLPSVAGDQVLFTRLPLGDSCGGEVWRVPFAGGTSVKLASPRDRVVAMGATSPTSFAFATSGCGSARASIVVVGTAARTVPLPSGVGVGGLSLRSDGTLAVATHSGTAHELRVLAPSATSLTAGRVVAAPDTGCFLTTPAFAGNATQTLAAVELCSSATGPTRGKPTLMRFASDSCRLLARGPAVAGDLEVGRLDSAPGGAFIGQVTGGDVIGDIFVIEGQSVRVVRKAEGCYSTQRPPYPCAQDPSW